MKYRFLSVLMIGVGIGVVGCEDDDADAPAEGTVEEPAGDGVASAGTFEFTGMVDGIAIEHGGDGGDAGGAITEVYVIRGDDGVNYDPQGTLPSEFDEAGIRVWVLAEDGGGTCSVGKRINIVRIRRL